ncbi:hypothetical protein AAC387_Pa03g1921 [Persea americana]
MSLYVWQMLEEYPAVYPSTSQLQPLHRELTLDEGMPRETLKTYLIQKKIEEKKVTTMYGFSTKFSNSIMRTGIFGGDRIFAAGFVTMDSNLAGLRFFIAMASAKFWP